MHIKTMLRIGLLLLAAAMILTACGRGRDTEVEVAVALTQTASAVEQPTAPEASLTPAPEAVAAPDETATLPAPTDDTADKAAAPSAPALLPAPLFFIDRETEQVTRLEVDGMTLVPLTVEQGAVLDFDVAPDGSRLAYVVDNDLVELHLETGDRTVKVNQEPLSNSAAEDRLERQLHEPHYSPDGRQIVFGLGGLYAIDSGSSTELSLLLANSSMADDSTSIPVNGQPVRAYWPKGWSPDGRKLLVEFAYDPEGGGLAIYDLEQQKLIDFSSDDPAAAVCCDAAWSPDSLSLYLASNLLVSGNPGLSVVDADSGMITPLVNGLPAAGEADASFRFFSAPYAADDGLLVFLNETPELAQQMMSYVLSSVSADGERVLPLRDDAQPLEGEAVWVADGSGIAYLKEPQIEGERRTGAIVWLPINGDAVDLPASGQALRFPAPEPSPQSPGKDAAQPLPVPAEDEEAAALSAFVAELWGFDFTDGADDGAGIHGIFSFPLQTPTDNAPLWASHTVGRRGFDPEQAHLVGIFTRAGDAWQERARLTLGEGADSVSAEPLPDFLDPGFVAQVNIEPEQIWLSVEGGTGAHSGTFNLLSYDSDTLRIEASAFGASPNIARFADLNGDGKLEVILDASDYYVYCYACGVQLAQYNLLRWNGKRMEEVLLQDLAVDALPALDALNDQAITYVSGGLWKDALAAVEEGRALDQEDATFTWNGILIELNTEAKRAIAEDPTAGDPILDPIFYGDYDAAVDVLRAYTPAEIYTLESPLLMDSAAEGSTELLADWITQTTASALDVMPDLAPAHYLRGWSGYLSTEENEVALQDVALAAAMDPKDAFYRDSLAYLLGDSMPTSAPTEAASQETPASATPVVQSSPTAVPATPDAATSSGSADFVRALIPVNVRSGPGTGAGIIGELNEGDTAPVRGRTDEDIELWWQIVYPPGSDERGWVSGDPTLVDVTATDVPVAAIAIEPRDPEPADGSASGSGGVSGAISGGGRLFFSAQDEEGETVIYQLDADGTAAMVVSSAAQPAIQPQGRRLAFFSTRDDMLGLGGYDLDTDARLRFAFNYEDALPTWDPSTQQIIFTSTRYGDGRSRLYQIWADGQGDAVDIGYGQDPDWHPKEALIVFKGCDETGVRCGLWTMRPDGSGRRQLTENSNDARPAWTPDGRAVIFMNNDRDGNWELYRLDVSSGDVSRLTDNGANDGLPAVSPDGSQIAFMSDRGGVWTIQVMPVDGGSAQTLYTIGDDVADWLSQGIAWER